MSLIQVQKEKEKFPRCLFTSSMKREIRHLQVVVVQGRQRNVKKHSVARAKLLFATYSFFGRSRYRRRGRIIRFLPECRVPL